MPKRPVKKQIKPYTYRRKDGKLIRVPTHKRTYHMGKKVKYIPVQPGQIFYCKGCGNPRKTIYTVKFKEKDEFGEDEGEYCADCRDELLRQEKKQDYTILQWREKTMSPPAFGLPDEEVEDTKYRVYMDEGYHGEFETHVKEFETITEAEEYGMIIWKKAEDGKIETDVANGMCIEKRVGDKWEIHKDLWESDEGWVRSEE